VVVHAEPQQKPSTHAMFVHWSANVHAAPLACLGTHAPLALQ